jgi:Mg/Co/Ni transporter MgtE
MSTNRIRHIRVVDQNSKLISIVSIGDVIKIYVDELTNDRNALHGYIVGG